MSYISVEFIGAFGRWVFKGFKTKFKDEVDGNFDAKWGKSYECENFIIGIITSLVLIIIAFNIYIL